MKNTAKSLLMLVGALCCSLMGLAQPNHYIHGEVDASSIPENAFVYLNGPTTIKMDVGKQLAGISGKNYDLTITGTGKLSVRPDKLYSQRVINLRNLAINQGVQVEVDAPTANNKGVYVDQYLQVQGSFSVNSHESAISGGHLTVDGGSVSAIGKDFGIYVNTLDINGEVKAQGAKYSGINVEGKMTVTGGTVKAIGSVSGIYVLQADLGGEIQVVGTGEDSNGIVAGSQLVIRGKVTAIGRDHGIHAQNATINFYNCEATAMGNIGIWSAIGIKCDNSIVKANCTGEECIHAESYVSVTGGKVEATALLPKYGIHAKQFFEFKYGELSARGYQNAIYAEGDIRLSTKDIAVPANGNLSDDWKTIVSPNGAAKVVKLVDNHYIDGKALLSGNAVPGQPLTYTLQGDISMVTSDKIKTAWQLSTDDVNWATIGGATEGYYVPVLLQVGKYIRVSLTVDGYSNAIVSTSRFIDKVINTKNPVAATLKYENGKVYVENAMKNQEYIILNYKKNVSMLTASDWAAAKQTDTNNSQLEMGGTDKSMNYVYTRMRETTSELVGTTVYLSTIYAGESIYWQEFFISPQQDTRLSNTEWKGEVGKPIPIEVSTHPVNATDFDGISGSRWLVDNFQSRDYATFWSNKECTIPLNSSNTYKRVYLKVTEVRDFIEVSAERNRGYNDVVRSTFTLHMVDAEGDVLLDHVSIGNGKIAAGDKLEGIRFYKYPTMASINGLTVEASGAGSAPVFTFNQSTGNMTIDATSATVGTYNYKVLQKGKEIPQAFSIEVASGAPAVEDILLEPVYLEADPGDVIELAAQLTPVGAEGTIAWNCSAYATVNNGVVTILSTAPRGQEITVTASAGGHSATCTIHIRKMQSELAFGDYNPIVFVGEAFTPPTLVNPDHLSITYSSSNENVAKVNSSTGVVTVVGAGNAVIFASPQSSQYEANAAFYWLTALKHSADLSFAAYEVKVKLGEAFTSPVLSNPNNLPVTWTSWDTSVATVDQTGKVTLLGEGSTYIFATFAGNDTYDSYSALYYLVVEKASAITTVSSQPEVTGPWHLLDGRRLESRPTKRGVYVVNGRKVTIK